MFKTGEVTRGIPLGFSFSGDGQFIAMGKLCLYGIIVFKLPALGSETGGNISIFDVVTAEDVTSGHAVFGKGHISPVTDLQWNPTRGMLAGLHCNMNFWTCSNI